VTNLNIRKRMWSEKVSGKDVGDFARDVSEALSTIPFLKIKRFEAPYTEPFYVSSNVEPEGLLCLRIIRVGSGQLQQSPVLTGALCHFTWDGQKRRIVIESIDGMSPSPGLLFRYSFLLIG
jgi:hypothetical protein